MKVHKNFHYKLFPSTTINFYSFFVALPCSRCSSPFFVPLFSVLPISPFSVHPISFHFSVIPISLFSPISFHFSVLPISILPTLCLKAISYGCPFSSVVLSFRCDFIRLWSLFPRCSYESRSVNSVVISFNFYSGMLVLFFLSRTSLFPPFLLNPISILPGLCLNAISFSCRGDLLFVWRRS